MMSAASGCPVGLSVDKASGSRWENRIYENSSTRKPMNRRGGGPTKATTLFNFFSDTHYNYCVSYSSFPRNALICLRGEARACPTGDSLLVLERQEIPLSGGVDH
jgi:hypothetical protein